MENTGNWFCPSKDKLIRCYKNGYNVITLFCFVPFYELWSRIEKRVIKEGRGIDIDNAKNNVKSALEKIDEVMNISDNYYILSNLVDPKNPPEIILHGNFNSKEDDTKCKKIITKNDKVIRKLIKKM